MFRVLSAHLAAVFTFVLALALPEPVGATLTTGPFPACQGLDQVLGRNAAGTDLVIDSVDYLLPGPFQAPAAFEFQRSTGTGFVVARATDLVPPNDRLVVFLIPPVPGDLLVEVEDVVSARGFAFECVFENAAASPLSRLGYVENSNPTGSDQRVLWVDISDSPGADGFSLHDEQIESVRFAPSGTAAVVKHSLPTDAEWAVIDTCPGATGTVLANLTNLGADVSLALIDTDGAYAVELTPQVGAPVQVPVDDCLGGSPDRTLDVVVGGTGPGTVTGDGGQISCSTAGGTCQGTYPDGTVVQLTATSSSVSRFVGWGGDCDGTDSTETVTLDQDRTCTADFDLAEADLDPFVSATPDPAVAGSLVDLVVGVTNRGPDPTTVANATVALPTGFVFQPEGSDPQCTLLGANVRCVFGVIGNGASASATVRLFIEPDVRGTQNLTVSASGQPTDPVPGNNSETLALDVDGIADLVLVKRSVVDQAAPGEVIAWTVEVTNFGPSTALDAVVTDPLPQWVNSPFDAGATTLACPIAALPPGESLRLTIFGRLDDSAPVGSLIINTADVVSSEADPSPGDAVDSDDVTVSSQNPPGPAERWTLVAEAGQPGPFGQPWERFEAPAVDGEGVAFAGYANDVLTSDVRWWIDGTSFPVVESGSGVPGAGGTLVTGFQGVSADDGQVAFTGFRIGFGGTYATAACGLELIADDAGNLGAFEGQIAGGVMVQVASGGNGFYGVVRVDDSVTVIAARGDQIPGAPAGTTFSGFGHPPAWDGTTAVFFGDAGAPPSGGSIEFPGIFWWRDGVLDVLADTATPAPDGGNFLSFNIDVAVDGDLAWFFGTTANGRGLYRADLDTGAITLVANPGQALPDGAGTFSIVGPEVAADDGRAAFVAIAEPPEAGGIFLADASGVRRLATVGEPLPGGHALWAARIGFDALDGRYLGVLTGLSTIVPERIWRLDIEAGEVIFANGFEPSSRSAR